MIDYLIDTLKDTYLMFPLLFVMYCILEYIEHQNKHEHYEHKLSQFGPLLGSFIGIVPQCGFGVIASLLFIEQKISLGTLISIFIATSDEALPILLAYPKLYSSLFVLILIKCGIAVIVGYLVDFVFKKPLDVASSISFHTHEHHHSLIKESFIRTLKVYAFIFSFNFFISILISLIGNDTLSSWLLSNSVFQPVLASLFGFIPNCAASVILTELYINNMVSFASLLSGLITNAGLGILILIERKVPFLSILKICIILFIASIIFTLPMQVFSFL